MAIKKDDQYGIRIVGDGFGGYEVQFQEHTKSGKPKWISNALMQTSSLEQAKEWFQDMVKNSSNRPLQP